MTRSLQKSLSAAGSTVFLEQFVWVTPSMDRRNLPETYLKLQVPAKLETSSSPYFGS